MCIKDWNEIWDTLLSIKRGTYTAAYTSGKAEYNNALLCMSIVDDEVEKVQLKLLEMRNKMLQEQRIA